MKYISFDTETYVQDQPNPDLVCMSYCYGDASERETGLLSIKEDIKKVIEEWLRDDDTTLVAHNSMFDFGVMKHAFPHLDELIYQKYKKGLVFDTQIFQTLLNIEKGSQFKLVQSLSDLCQIYLGVEPEGKVQLKDSYEEHAKKVEEIKQELLSGEFDREMDWRLFYGALDGLDISRWPERARTYALEDAEHTFDVFKAQQTEYHSFDEAELTFQTYTAWCLKMMTDWGIKVDPVATDKLDSEITPACEMLMSDLLDDGIYTLEATNNISEINRKIEQDLESNGYQVPRTKSGSVSRSAATFEMVEDNDVLTWWELWSDKENRHLLTGEKGLEQAGLININLKKNTSKIKNIVEDWFKCRGDEIPKTDSGGTKIDKNVLKKIDNPSIQKLYKLSELDKIRTSFLPVLKNNSGTTIHPRWKVLVASGRTACSSPNLQNQPRRPGIRECFVPRDGNVFIACDYTAAEMASLSQVCYDLFGFSRIGEAINEGKDLHIVAGSAIAGVDYEYFKSALAASENIKGIKAKVYRQLAKIMNFGVPGGMQAAALYIQVKRALPGFEITEAEVDNIRDKHLATFPEIDLLVRYIKQIKYKYGQNVDGFEIMQHKSTRKRGGLRVTSAQNTLFQGLTADGAKRALNAVTDACYFDSESVLYGYRPVAFVHDEIIIEGPEETCHEASVELEKVMIAQMKTLITDIKVEATSDVMPRWFKEVDQKFDDQGRKIPSKPKDYWMDLDANHYIEIVNSLK